MKTRKIMVVLLLVATVMVVGVVSAETATPGEIKPLLAVDLTPVLQAVIALIASLITAKLIPYIKSKTNANQQLMLQSAINVLVYAAEQIYGAGNGRAKLDYVKKELAKKGYDVDVATIEGAVKRLLNPPKI